MFGPKHTVESVGSEPVIGLEDGTVILDSEEPTEADLLNFQRSMAIASEKYRSRATRFLIATTIGIVSSMTASVTMLFIDPKSHLQPYSGWALTLVGGAVFLLSITGAPLSLAGLAFTYTAGKRAAELRTCIRIMKIADRITAKRIMLREIPRLREKEPVF
ncbi:MAG: hypothetical protein ACLQIB_39860 [Isosphaeraceae bacterium]